jgi:hypothetical protein
MDYHIIPIKNKGGPYPPPVHVPADGLTRTVLQEDVKKMQEKI